MLGRHGFDHERLFGASDFRRLSEAAAASVSFETAAPLAEALGRSPGEDSVELAAFAASVQGLAPLLAARADLSVLPPPLAEFLAGERATSTARATVLAAALAELTSTLGSAGIVTVALKGAALAFRDYPEPAFRPMGDLDLLLSGPGRLGDATRLLASLGWDRYLDTPRHRVFVRPDERVPRPACEDPENPIRVELHTAFRLPVLGREYDATAALLAAAEPRRIGGVEVRLASGNALGRHLLFHAAEDFASRGLRGIQAYDFRLLARASGPLRIAFSEANREAGLGPAAFAARAVEALFPGSFAPELLDELSAGVPPHRLASAGRLAPLRHTRPGQGQALALAPLVETPVRRIRFLLRATFPTSGEVKATEEPGAAGLSLLVAWGAGVLKRIGRGIAQLLRRPA